MEYEVTLNGKPLNAVIRDVQTVDRDGAMADDIRVVILNDTTTNIAEGDFLACSFGGYRSGEMSIDRIDSGTKTTVIGAISAPLCAKEKKTRHWLKVRLFDIVNDIATSCSLNVYYQGVTNYFYENVTQHKETDLAFLSRLCGREGYALKIDDNRLVIYDKSVIKDREPVKTITLADILDNRVTFSESPNKTMSVTVKYYADRLIEYTATKGTIGEKKTIKEYLADGAEAERFAKNYLALAKENDVTADALIQLNDGIAAGNCVVFEGFGRFDGKYFISECCHNPESDQTRLLGRKII